MTEPLDRVRAEVKAALAAADAAGFRVVAETLTWVVAVIDRERNHQELKPREPKP